MSTARAARHQMIADVTPEATDLDESLTLPGVEIPSDDESTDDETFVPEECYKEWIGCQNKYTIKIMALILMDTFRTRFGLTDVAAASEAGLVGYSEKSIRSWHKEFYEREYDESLKPYVAIR